MATLAEPSRELALKVLGEVEDDQCLGSYRLTAMGGNSFHPIYSFAAAVNFLTADCDELLSLRTNRGAIGYVDPGVLKRWVAEVFEDRELAEAIDQEIAKGESYVGQMEAIRALMAERLRLCLALVEENA